MYINNKYVNVNNGDNMNNKSIWENIDKPFDFANKKLENTDILIIGGGITGLSLAYFLKDSGKKVTLIDKGQIGGGITAKTTAKISYMQGIIYQNLENKFNRNVAHKYYKSQKDAIFLIGKIIRDNNISCDLEKVDSIVFTMNEENIEKIQREKQLLEDFGENIKFTTDDSILTGILGKNNYIMHPLKFVYSLVNIVKDSVSLHENILANNIEKKYRYYEVSTNKGNIKAKKVIVCTHYPFFLFPTLIPFKTYVKREYICASKVKKKENITYINIDDDLYSVRYYKNYLIYVTDKKRLTDNVDYVNSFKDSRYKFKENFLKEPEYTYINQDVMSNDGLPFIGEIDTNLYLATAYNAWGMTNGVLAAKIIYDLIIYGTSKYKYLFDPNRSNISLFLSSIVGSFHYARAYTVSLFKKNVPNYVKIKNILYGVYVDENDEKHMIKLVCPHMKCNLVFNNAELTWDCPCHGSRFSLDGHLLEGPATVDLINK